MIGKILKTMRKSNKLSQEQDITLSSKNIDRNEL